MIEVNPKKPINMFVVRDVFNLKYGLFKEAMASIRQAVKEGLLPEKKVRILSDFTGDAYRLIMESGYASLADYEKDLTEGMKDPRFAEFYSVFKTYVVSGHREILRQHQL